MKKYNNILQSPRRLRYNKNIRSIVRETRLNVKDFILPVFVVEGRNIKNPICSMPGVFQYSIDRVSEVLENAIKSGINSIILFGIPKNKNGLGTEAYSENGIVQNSIQYIKSTYPDLLVVSDVCLCGYTDHGHCGILKSRGIDNEGTLELLAKQALTHVHSGADIIAPSAMMDGMVASIRNSLDKEHFDHIPIMGYSVKYASSLYGPFRDAANSAPQFGHRYSYQMDPANINEAIKEVNLDVCEGVDIIMVKPALSYLDVVAKIKQKTKVPLACYNVSGEYSMLKAASENGWLDYNSVMIETLLSIKRAGADIIITYHAIEAAKLLN